MTTELSIEGEVQLSKENGIGTLQFYHPAANSLPGVLLSKLVDGIEKMGSDPAVKVIVLRSQGERSFCGGASFKELVSVQNLEEGHRFFMGFANVINAMRKCPKFIIGMVQGKTVGGGVGLAAATDYCLGAKSASVKLSELAIGIGPFVVGPAVERKLGNAAFSQLAINASEWCTAEWALEKGLYASIHEDYEKLEVAVYQLASRLANYSPEAMKRLKAILWEGTESWDALLPARAKISGELVLSDLAQQAIEEAKNKKKK